MLGLALIALAAVLWLSAARIAEELRRLREVQEAQHSYQVRCHREIKARETLVTDALAWLSAQVGAGVALKQLRPDVRGVEMVTANGGLLLVTPLSIEQLQPTTARGRLADFARQRKPRQSEERSLLHSDYFDLEADQAGRLLGVDWHGVERLWLHWH